MRGIGSYTTKKAGIFSEKKKTLIFKIHDIFVMKNMYCVTFFFFVKYYSTEFLKLPYSDLFKKKKNPFFEFLSNVSSMHQVDNNVARVVHKYH